MKLFNPRPGDRWLFGMTHPDDELSICAWMKRLVDSGAEVHVSWTHSIPEREGEGRRVMKILGVPQENLHFFHGTDGSVCDEIPQLIPQFQKLIGEIEPQFVACGAFEQGHLDHDATNYILNHTFKGTLLEIPFYHSYITRLQTFSRFTLPEGEERLTLTPEEQQLKIQVAKMYPSQNIWSLLVAFEMLQRASASRHRLLHWERMRPQIHTDYLAPNHPPKLANRIRRTKKWKRWEAAMKNAGFQPRSVT